MLNCKWQFQVGINNRIIFQFFQLFSTELGYDRVSVSYLKILNYKIKSHNFIFNVQIYDGSTPTSPMIIEQSGNESISHIFSTSSNTAMVRFTTDNSLTFPGFALYYSSVINCYGFESRVAKKKNNLSGEYRNQFLLAEECFTLMELLKLQISLLTIPHLPNAVGL